MRVSFGCFDGDFGLLRVFLGSLQTLRPHCSCLSFLEHPSENSLRVIPSSTAAPAARSFQEASFGWISILCICSPDDEADLVQVGLPKLGTWTLNSKDRRKRGSGGSLLKMCSRKTVLVNVYGCTSSDVFTMVLLASQDSSRCGEVKLAEGEAKAKELQGSGVRRTGGREEDRFSER